MELAVGSLGSLLGSALGGALAGKPKYGFKDVSQTRTVTQLDPKQLQQILDDLTRAETSGRADITSGVMNAIGMITGDTQYGARDSALKAAAKQATLAQQRQFLEQNGLSDLRNQLGQAQAALQSQRSAEDIYQQLRREGFVDTSMANARREANRIFQGERNRTLRQIEELNGKLQKIEADPKAALAILPNFMGKNPQSQALLNQFNSINEGSSQVQSIARQQLMASNPELFVNEGGSNTVPIDPYFKSSQNLNLNALNQMAALNGIRGSDGQAGMTPDQIQANLEATPGYQFRYNQGRQAVERSASARGLLDSGAILKGLTQFGQGLASQEFAANYERLANLAGQTANASLSGASLATTLPQQNRLAAADLYANQGTSLANLSNTMAGARASALQNSGTNTQKSTSSLLFDINSMTPVVGGR